HDRGKSHLVRQQSLLRSRHEVVEHVLHPALAAQVHEAARELELVVETSADEKDDEVPLDLDRHAPTGHFAHCHHPSVVDSERQSYLRGSRYRGRSSARGSLAASTAVPSSSAAEIAKVACKPPVKLDPAAPISEPNRATPITLPVWRAVLSVPDAMPE